MIVLVQIEVHIRKHDGEIPKLIEDKAWQTN